VTLGPPLDVFGMPRPGNDLKGIFIFGSIGGFLRLFYLGRIYSIGKELFCVLAALSRVCKGD
jgi:hypothetical protein